MLLSDLNDLLHVPNMLHPLMFTHEKQRCRWKNKEVVREHCFILIDRELLTGSFNPIFFKRFDLQNILRFARGIKSIQAALLNLVELAPVTEHIVPISGYISTHELHVSHFQLMMPTKKLIKQIMKRTKIFKGKGPSYPQESGVMWP